MMVSSEIDRYITLGIARKEGTSMSSHECISCMAALSKRDHLLTLVLSD